MTQFCHAGAARKYEITDEMKEEIREAYQNRVGMKSSRNCGVVKALAEKFGIPRWKVSRVAQEMGIIPKEKGKRPGWSKEEDDIVLKKIQFTPTIIARHLKAAGYQRSIASVALRIKRLGGVKEFLQGYSASELAGLFGVDIHSITDVWIARGLLDAERRGTDRHAKQGGDIWFIRPEAVKRFITINVDLVDFHKLDKYWLVELLTQEA